MTESNEKDGFALRRFGRYLILDHLVDGGMATICRARFLGEQADKIVAIKMVQPQYSKDESFKTMFMDEIKVTFGLIHPNIAQTYDYGVHNDQLYTAMEYVDGKNLKQYLDKLREKKFVFPVEISVYIISQACQGLQYAHTLTDKLTGKRANIIHRDISPHNLMLTYDGAVKIIDFGIAKAESNSESTQAGTIKGKLSYLAPEYLEGKDLDPRYDQFAVGITLWEMLCSRKLFKAKNDLAVLKLIQACKVPPPSSINPNVPKELDEIVLTALSRDREKRFKDMDQLNRALVKFLYSNYSDFNATDLSYFANELFKEDIEKDRRKLFEFGKIDLAPYLDELKREQSGEKITSDNAISSSRASSGDLEPTRKKARVLDFGFEEESSAKPARKRLTRASPTKSVAASRPAPTAAPASSVPPVKQETGTLTINVSKKTRTVGEATAVRSIPLPQEATGSNKTAVKKLPEKKAASKKAQLIAILVILAVGLGGYKLFSGGKETKAVKPINNVVTTNDEQSTVQEDEQGTGLIEFTNFTRHRQLLFINGQKVNVSVLGEVEVPYGKNIVLRVQEQGREHYVTTIALNGRTPSKQITIPQMPPASYGYLITSKDCINGKLLFTLFGEERQESLPIRNSRGIAFPVGTNDSGSIVPVTYTVYYQKTYEEIQRKAAFTIKHIDHAVDFCSVIGND